MVSKRLLAMAVPVVLIALLLGACGNKNESANTTSTSEAQSPIGDSSENADFCNEFVQETNTAHANSSELSTAMTTLATDAPTEIQPAFETLATGVNNDATATTSAQQSSTMASAWTQVETFMAKTCPNVNTSELQKMLGIDANTSTSTPATTHG